MAITLDVTLNKADYAEYCLYVANSIGHRQLYTSVFWGAFLAFFASTFVRPTTTSNDVIVFYTLIVILFFCVFYAVAYIISSRKRLDQYIGDGMFFLEPKHITFDEKGVTAESETGRYTIFWKGIYTIKESKNAFYLFFDKNQAMIIPTRCFPTPEESSKFLLAITNYWKTAHL